ncbi:uncharacterized protein LOC129600248 [Paramacrobiotus metropolitanus]|uniref:uncharacterized protein LOC129600248 n=1 Tax=Paramacrobiotus metropolitanus TaxID=2943436 RepID=UPI0024460B58|nr:uncharacterized protein LOC129600248 [Paramacrobiotus metropolitanus]
MLLSRDYTCSWNSVDVLVDGLLQHGKIVNLAEGGLIIDFGCAAQRSHFIAYGTVFRCQSRVASLGAWQALQGDLQVLLRPRQNAAMSWYPGKVARGCVFGKTAFVQVQLPHGTVEEVVRWEQVRPALPEGGYELLRMVMPNEFVIRACRLPVAYWSEATPQLGEILQCRVNQRYKVLCTAVLSQTLLYLQAHEHVPLTAEQLQEQCDAAKKTQAGVGSLPALQSRTCSARKTRKTAANCRLSLPLPPELLVAIFQTLDSVERVRCRRVCAAWNTLLTTEAYFPDVRVSADYAVYGEEISPTTAPTGCWPVYSSA